MLGLRAKRRWLQFSLRGLLALVTLGCVALAPRVNRAHRDRQALAMMRRVPCKKLLVYYDYHDISSTGGAYIDTPKPGPEWLRRLLGDEYFMRVEQVYLRDRGVKDEHLCCLEPLVGDLKGLSLHSSSVGHGGLAYLSKFKALRRLDLGQIWPPIDASAIGHLTQLPELRYLCLAMAHVADDDVLQLARLKKLEILDVSGTKMTIDGLCRLQAALPSCELYWHMGGRFDATNLPIVGAPEPPAR